MVLTEIPDSDFYESAVPMLETWGQWRSEGSLQGYGPSENISVVMPNVMKKETILLVDDDESVVSMLAKSLEESYHVLVAVDGMAAAGVVAQRCSDKQR